MRSRTSYLFMCLHKLYVYLKFRTHEALNAKKSHKPKLLVLSTIFEMLIPIAKERICCSVT